MLFNSAGFVFFFFTVFFAYFATPHRFRWILLLVASYTFYIFSKAEFLLWMSISTLFTYGGALQLGSVAEPSRRKKIFLFTLFGNIVFLLVFKYFNFFNESLKWILNLFGFSYRFPRFHFLLPLGISFYTFKNLSYLTDVYWGKIPPEKHLGKFALYVSFFPQLLAGPIERAVRLLPQFRERYVFDYERVSHGLRLMLWGLFQKIVIADNLAVLVDHVFDHPTRYHGTSLIMATFFFAFQIYCDFSGYSDIAIGVAECLGYKTMENFNRPYFATSISDFWRRWHISLSTWFRDYLYIPLGGNRVSIPRLYLNLIVVFLICGLWHGANWTFVIWGGIHGFYLVFSLMTQGLRTRIHQGIRLNKAPRIHASLKVLTTFFLVCLAWIFFRANHLSEALYIISQWFVGWADFFRPGAWETTPFQGLELEFLAGTVSVGFLIFVHLMQERLSWTRMLFDKPVWVRWSVYYAGVLAILLVGSSGSKQFIYFQF